MSRTRDSSMTCPMLLLSCSVTAVGTLCVDNDDDKVDNSDDVIDNDNADDDDNIGL